MVRTITLKYAGRCKDCGADLAVGEKAKWYGRGKVYGLDCHDKPEGMSSSTYFTIEPSVVGLGIDNEFTVYEWGTYDRSSVLAGQQKKSYRDTFQTVALALEAYPKADVMEWTVSANNTFDHLPDEDDPISDAERFERAYMEPALDAYVTVGGEMDY